MKKIILFVFFNVMMVNINSQPLELKWADRIGGPMVTYLRKMITDDIGNSFSLVSFSSTVDFDPGPSVYNVTAVGSTDFALVKLNSNGHFLWMQHFGGTNHEIGNGITMDNAGNLFITGMFNGTCDFDPGPGITSVNSTSSTTFFMKLDSNGNLIWVKHFSGTGTSIGRSVELDGSGNVIIHGDFSGTFDFDPGTATINMTASATHLFITKFDLAGNYLWSHTFGSANSTGSRGIAIDPNNDIYCTSIFGGTVDFDPGAGVFNLTASGPFDIVIFKLSAAGNFVWAGQLTGPVWEQVYDIKVDATNNVVLTGNFNDVVDFDPGPAIYNLSSSGPGIANTFILKLTSSGTLSFAKKLDCTITSVGHGIIIDNSGNIIITGSFQGTINFDPGPGVQNFTSTGNQAWYVLKLNAAGNYLWSAAASGDYYNQGISVGVDLDESIYVGGYFYGSMDFDPDPTITNLMTSTALPDMFLVKFGSTTLPVSFLFFEGIRKEKNVDLKWSTASELNNNYFTVERSTNGENFSLCGIVDGKGNTTELSNYYFTDYNVSAGIIYYRLTQTDYDGKSEVLSTIVIKGKNNSGDFSVITDPLTGRITVIAPENLIGPAMLNIIDLNGRVVFSKLILINNSINYYELETDNHLSELCFLTISNEQEYFSRFLFKR
jgi:hypothetical protein